MSDIILSNKQSPRYENKTWKWYVYNTFNLIFKIRLLDSDDQEITIGENDYIQVEFYQKGKTLVHTFKFTDLEWTTPQSGNNYIEIILDFDEEVSKKFEVNKYTFCITYYGDEITTVYADGNVEVELCH